MIAYSPLALGLLTGKYQAGKALPPGLRGFLFKQLLPKIEPLLNCLAEIAQQRGKSSAQVALNWCISKGTMPIPDAKSVQPMQENLGALGWRLSEAEVEALDRTVAKLDQVMVQNIFQSR